MSNKKKRKKSNEPSWKRQRRLRVRGVRLEEPDLRRLGRTLIDLALAEAAAQEQHEKGKDLDGGAK